MVEGCGSMAQCTSRPLRKSSSAQVRSFAPIFFSIGSVLRIQHKATDSCAVVALWRLIGCSDESQKRHIFLQVVPRPNIVVSQPACLRVLHSRGLGPSSAAWLHPVGMRWGVRNVGGVNLQRQLGRYTVLMGKVQRILTLFLLTAAPLYGSPDEEKLGKCSSSHIKLH